MDFELRQRLAGPVTGIIGATYPKEHMADLANLRPANDAGTQASIGGASQLRKLANFNDGFSLSAGVMGLAPTMP